MAATPSGKDKVLRWARVYVGAYDLSGDALQVSNMRNEFGFAPVTGWSEAVRNYVSSSVRENVSINGFRALINDDTGRAFTILKSSTNDNPISFVFGGGGEPAIPDPAFLMPATQINDRTSFANNIGIIEADFIYDAKQYDAYSINPMGVLLQAQTSLTSTETGASHDNEGSSANGWQANLHVLVSSGGTWAFVIEDSANDSDWATLGTFNADGSTVLAEQLSAVGAVDQYVRVVSTRTSGTVTAVITFSRA